jgi:hypothetical protein
VSGIDFVNLKTYDMYCLVLAGMQGGTMNNTMLALLPFVVLSVSSVTVQQQIQTGGPIPDRHGLNNAFDGPRVTSQVEEVVRRVAGNVCRLEPGHGVQQ